ncbi:uncharacterized protein LOC108223867 isoform X2 [Daucus carota subsp. sativus]|uniref:uncharacterized protein LOC108223867 isoform X2 n=1 Tax=Daucus carota subsp. sativus TaxID=79200 RepID=UPI0007F008D5|nr:PREDICTED: uncharacterized protein LOC108223867 isoform X2 [Daucus carota subsp. sativus]
MDRIRDIHNSRKTSTNTLGGNHKDRGTSKLVSPNVVARLMGLDGLPSPEVSHISQKVPADNKGKIALPKISDRDAHWRELRSYKKSYMEQSEFKDVFEDTINKSSSNKNLGTQFLQQSDSLFLENLPMQKAPSSYEYNRIAVLKPSHSTNQKAKDKGWQDEREGPMKHGFVRHTCNNHGSQSLYKSSTISPDRAGESDIMAKRIVILKPNYVKAHNAFNPVSLSSPDSSQFNFPVYSEYEQSEDSYREGYYRNMDIFKDVDFSRRKSREVTETVMKATREMRNTYSRMKNRRGTAKELNGETVEEFGYVMNNFPSPFRGSPDISGLYDFSGNVTASESEETKLTYDFTESFASSEAKKRLLERLKKAYKYEDKRNMTRDVYQYAGMDGKKITLGEMLSTSDKKVRNLDVTMGGISSKDGWKDSFSKYSSNSRSICQLPGVVSEKNNAGGECRVDDKLLVPKEDTYQYQRKVVDKNCKKKENSSLNSLKSSKRRSLSDRKKYAYNTDSSLEIYPSQDQTETNFNKEGSPDKQLGASQTSGNITSIADADIIQNGSRNLSPRSSDEMPQEPSIFMKNSDDSSVGNQENSTPQRTKAEAESLESSKEADHPSPVSVLQVPLREDDALSGPESFEQVSADLRELQKQLQLLRRESRSDEGDSTPQDDDYDVQQGSVTDSDHRRENKPECWESSYIADVLIESGFADTDTDMFMTICYSTDCPLGPWVFDNLESKHYSEVNRLKHDRRLLFDRINIALSGMPKSFAEPLPWVKPSAVGIRFKWQACEIRDELYKLLEVQVREASEEDSEKLLDKEMHWMGSRDCIDAIGVEIEKLLTDELLTELLNDVKFSN